MTRIISIVGGLQPSAPTIGTATAGDGSASVAFTPSTYIGKGTITYTATSSPGGFTGTGSSSPITVSGLTNGTAYTFTVVGTTNYGVASATSAASNSITPASNANFDLIATATPTSSGQAVVTFSSIPATYNNLFMTWTINGVSNGDIYIKLNGYSASASQQGWNGSVGQGATANTYNGYLNYAINVNPNYSHAGYAYINGYATAYEKNVLAWNSAIGTSSTEITQSMNIFPNAGSTAINEISLGVSAGGYGTTSKIALYGIKAS
jgi:hypothetical protein